MKALYGSLMCGAIILGAGVSTITQYASAQDTSMSFFITSAGPGDGANLGGLEGADAHCQKLAEAAGAGGKTWHAYLSSGTANARDRIGSGPWHNAKGELIASNLDELHSDANKISKQTGLTEAGAMVNGRGDAPNVHDILTGTNADGTVAAGMTCNDWTNNAEGQAFVGHHDRMGLRDDAPSKSWNASHPSRGCGKDDLPKSGGNGLFYCSAVTTRALVPRGVKALRVVFTCPVLGITRGVTVTGAPTFGPIYFCDPKFFCVPPCGTTWRWMTRGAVCVGATTTGACLGTTRG